jgi:hypothetical protein
LPIVVGRPAKRFYFRRATANSNPNIIVNTASPRHAPAAVGVWILAATTRTGAAIIQFARDVRHEALQAGPVASLEVVAIDGIAESSQHVERVAQVGDLAPVDSHAIEDSRGARELVRRHHNLDVAP